MAILQTINKNSQSGSSKYNINYKYTWRASFNIRKNLDLKQPYLI